MTTAELEKKKEQYRLNGKRNWTYRNKKTTIRIRWCEARGWERFSAGKNQYWFPIDDDEARAIVKDPAANVEAE